MLIRTRPLWAIMILVAASPAQAHPLTPDNGFMYGLAHAWTGLDHLLVMFTVGAWAVLTLGRSAWVAPAAFAASMALGTLAALCGLALPGVETGVAISVLAIGMLLVALVSLRPAMAALAVAAFALFHGNAHGTGFPLTVPAAWYVAGTVAGTLVLHALGMAAGRHVFAQRVAWARWTGAAMALVGGWLLASA